VDALHALARRSSSKVFPTGLSEYFLIVFLLRKRLSILSMGLIIEYITKETFSVKIC
jgi:hypothetical protein